MKNSKHVAMVAALVIPAGLVWYAAKHETKTAASPLSFTSPVLIAAQPVGPAALVAALVPATEPSPVVDTIGADGVLKHIAQPGETVTSLAASILGQNTKSNRDSIINANSSLRTDPDRLLAGKSYHIPQAGDAPANVEPVAPVGAAAPTPTSSANDLRYTAARGDTVEKLAGAFLGNGDQAHQDTITDANPSLQNNPDRLLAGKTYRIPAPAGLSATPDDATRRPTTQPDSDQVISESTPRLLKYTARAGDNVSTLAIKLLASDTQESRNAIINNNPSLKRDPDHLVAGQTYWIPAPIAGITNP